MNECDRLKEAFRNRLNGIADPITEDIRSFLKLDVREDTEYYHGTSQKSYNEIKKSGLKSQSETGVDVTHFGGYHQTRERFYITTNPLYAADMAVNRAMLDDSPPVVLKMSVQDLKNNCSLFPEDEPEGSMNVDVKCRPNEIVADCTKSPTVVGVVDEQVFRDLFLLPGYWSQEEDIRELAKFGIIVKEPDRRVLNNYNELRKELGRRPTNTEWFLYKYHRLPTH